MLMGYFWGTCKDILLTLFHQVEAVHSNVLPLQMIVNVQQQICQECVNEIIDASVALPI